ncbi:thymidylate synthase [Stenotrophomonas phage vB_SmaS_DLP_3]|nr:thymidylate synthase [Stenotrophomonas phage vB_SmaS_DLP_3]
MSKRGKGYKGAMTIVGDLLGTGGGNYRRCYEDHPVIEFDNGEGKPVGILAGGNCGHPIHKDADVYIGLDWCFRRQHGANYPWEPESKSGVIEFEYSISDGRAPSDTASAVKMIDWICNQLQAGKKVHVGCIGGHGRTGMILSAVVAKMCAMEDAITWVRKNYCKKAVESREQVEWLAKNFGIKKVSGSKEGISHGGGTARNSISSHNNRYDPDKFPGKTSSSSGGYAGYQGSLAAENFGGKSQKITPMKSASDIWKST